MKCIDETVEIKGDYNSQSGQVLRLNYQTCDSSVESDCKSKTELQDWLKNKWIMILANRQIL